MAVKAICWCKDIERNTGNNQAINVAITMVIIGADLGNYIIPEVPWNAMSVDVTSKNQMLNDIAAKAKAELQANGVTFQASDTVAVMPN